MSLEGQERIVMAHSHAVVTHANEFLPSAFNIDPYGSGPGVDGLLDEFLCYGHRTVHNFSRRNAVNHSLIKYSDSI